MSDEYAGVSKADLIAENEDLLRVVAELITSIGYARSTLATELLGWAKARTDYSLDQIVVHAVAEYRADQSTIRRLTAAAEKESTS